MVMKGGPETETCLTVDVPPASRIRFACHCVRYHGAAAPWLLIPILKNALQG